MCLLKQLDTRHRTRMRRSSGAIFSLGIVNERGSVNTHAYVDPMSLKEIDPTIVDESAVRLDRKIDLSFVLGILGMSELKKLRVKCHGNGERLAGMPKESNRLGYSLTFERTTKYSSCDLERHPLRVGAIRQIAICAIDITERRPLKNNERAAMHVTSRRDTELCTASGPNLFPPITVLHLSKTAALY